MGGGDLNSKKSWHPNTMKNQERVWKAEQAVAEEKKRMLELQREHAEERDRAELNDIMSKRNSTSASDNRLAWMYDKPDKKVDQEAYLLGKTLDKNSEQSENVEQDPIPAVSRRVVGSSMLTAAGDAQVDMSRKMREDPLLLIKERERAARAALLNNPLQRRKLAELLRKEQEQRKETKVKKKSKKGDKDLDVLLASKLSALGASKGIDIATLLDSDDSSSDSEDEKAKKKKKKKKQKKEKSKKKKVKTRSSDSDSDRVVHKNKETHYDDHKRNTKTSEHECDKYYKESRKRKSSEDRQRSESPVTKKHHKKEYTGSRENDRDSSYRSKQYSNSDSTYSNRYNDVKEEPRKYSSQRKSPESVRRGIDQRGGKRRTVMSDEEKAAKLAEMASAGIEREIQRGSRVAQQRAADAAAERRPPAHSSSRSDARALPDSLESRLHSTRHYIQRDKRQMNENFARR